MGSKWGEAYLLKALKPTCTRHGWWLHNAIDYQSGPRFAEENKTEAGPDYVMSAAHIQIEVKNSSGDSGVLSDKLSDAQRKYLGLYGGYIFLAMKDEGKRVSPKTASFYLVPFYAWEEFERDKPQFKSIRRLPGTRCISTDHLLVNYKLEYGMNAEGQMAPIMPTYFLEGLRMRLQQSLAIVDAMLA